MGTSRLNSIALALLVCSVVMITPSLTAEATSEDLDLANMSLQDLLDVDIISASRRIETQSEAPATVDVYLAYRVARGFSVGLLVDNVFDEQYEHPGVRSADSGAEPGYWDDDNSWNGSKGWFNSLVPQPGRSISLSLRYRF